ncbi:MAG: transglycosylase domain-containing protein [Clostridia bacterium]|nr:transglycosylase domain-containing protein [Clostridia bacterium]
MKKTGKFLALAALGVAAVGFAVAVICGAALYFYAANKIDADIDYGALVSAKGLTSIIYAKDESGEYVETLRLHGAENRVRIDLENVPDHVRDAFVSIEDHRFYDHKGVDWRRTAGAALSFIDPGRSSYGGSTITQQLVKNLTGDDGFTVKRKLIEIMRALKLERSLSKSEILEAYLNTVYLSNGCYGIETASEYFFSKSAADLTLSEAASLAAILKYPYKYDPVKFPSNNVERRNTVLKRMLELGKISDAEYAAAIAEPLTLNVAQRASETRRLSWYEETVIDEVVRDLCEKYGCDKKTAAGIVYSGGLRIYTAENKKIQSALEKTYENEKNFPTSGILTPPESAAVIIDAHTGALLAIVGARGEKISDRTLNYATRLTRSPGSVIKPISVYAPAIDRDLITWSTVFDDVPVSFTETDNGFTMWPQNNPRVYSGLTNVAHALSSSINTVSVRILRKLGLENSFSFLKALSITTLVEGRQTESGARVSDVAEAPLALGALTDGCTLYQITGAYTMFATGGVHIKPYSYTEVYDSDGNLILQNEGAGVRMISEDSADIMTRMLENVVSSGTAKGMNISKNIAVAGKTGTSHADVDRWFIGYTPDYVCGVWYGYVDARSIGYYKTNPACDIFDTVMTAVYEETPELQKNGFTRSDNVVKCLYCRDSGMLASHDCTCDPRGNRIELGYFKKGTEPQSHCETHVCVNYDAAGGGVVSDMILFDEKNVKKTALVKNYSRSFPCRVYVADAEYTYRYLSPFTDPSENENEAYFQSLEEDGQYFGLSKTEKAFNRASKYYYGDFPEKETDDIYEDVLSRVFGRKK